ncbi:hypothetical protein N9383_03355 [Granulosicoccus sp.]|nr:hypothetical protein [Granulosicoccus sp.]
MPTDYEIWQWANDLESYGSMLQIEKIQCFEMILISHARVKLFIEIAESDALRRQFFLLCSYELTYQSVGKGGQDLKYLDYLRQRLSDWKSKLLFAR